MKVTVSVKRKGDLSGLMSKILAGAEAGLAIGGEMMAQAVKASITDMARYPTGELAGTVMYETQEAGASHIIGRVVAGSDHARWFEYGASLHFVPIESVDYRVIDGYYENAIPVYEYTEPQNGEKPSDSYKSDYQFDLGFDEIPIGFLISSSEHPFMEQGFNATVQTVVQEVANQVAIALQ